MLRIRLDPPSVPRDRCPSDPRWLDVQVLLLIIGNSLVLAAYDPEAPDSDHNVVLDKCGQVFTVLFTIEVSMKVIAR